MALEATRSDPGSWAATNMNFHYEALEKQKTDRWLVTTKDNVGSLGVVKWLSRWRKYCFFPAAGCVFEQDCLRDLADFIEERTKEHKAGV